MPFRLPIMASLPLIPVALLALVLDTDMGASMWSGAVAMLAVIGVLSVAPLILMLRRATAAVPLVLYLGLLLALPYIPSSPIKPFRWFFLGLHADMSPAEVDALLRVHFPDDGRYPRPVRRDLTGSTGYFLDPTDGRYNAELVSLEFSGERLVAWRYLGD